MGGFEGGFEGGGGLRRGGGRGLRRGASKGGLRRGRGFERGASKGGASKGGFTGRASKGGLQRGGFKGGASKGGLRRGASKGLRRGFEAPFVSAKVLRSSLRTLRPHEVKPPFAHPSSAQRSDEAPSLRPHEVTKPAFDPSTLRGPPSPPHPPPPTPSKPPSKPPTLLKGGFRPFTLVQDKSRQANEQCLVGIQPSMSCADTSHHAAGLAQQSDHSASQSIQQACKADATSTTEAENAGADEQSVVESTPQKSAEAATVADSVPNEQLVFESQAKRSRVHHRARQLDVTLKREVGQLEATMRSKSSAHRRAGV